MFKFYFFASLCLLPGCWLLPGGGSKTAEKTGRVLQEAAPFVPFPWGTLIEVLGGALVGAGATHHYHRRKQKAKHDK